MRCSNCNQDVIHSPIFPVQVTEDRVANLCSFCRAKLGFEGEVRIAQNAAMITAFNNLSRHVGTLTRILQNLEIDHDG